MRTEVIESGLAPVGLSVTLGNNDCYAIQNVARKVDDAIKQAIDQSKKIVSNNKKGEAIFDVHYEKPADIPVVLDLETVSRISWFLDNFNVNHEVDLFIFADSVATTILADINGKKTEEENE